MGSIHSKILGWIQPILGHPRTKHMHKSLYYYSLRPVRSALLEFKIRPKINALITIRPISMGVSSKFHLYLIL
jgi:hypothetical protein